MKVIITEKEGHQKTLNNVLTCSHSASTNIFTICFDDMVNDVTTKCTLRLNANNIESIVVAL